VLIPKGVEVLCFDTLLQVLILKGLRGGIGGLPVGVGEERSLVAMLFGTRILPGCSLLQVLILKGLREQVFGTADSKEVWSDLAGDGGGRPIIHAALYRESKRRSRGFWASAGRHRG
jgi:hypothetical protein